ncbi:MAG: CPBP family intramembrane metalloprotease [Bacteroidetes bacterium]|nr:CPBP family intramembrane metalloprotease [Bacteroidota bacterium]
MGRKSFYPLRFILLLLIAPAIFALKLSLDIPLHFSDDKGWNEYWNHVFYWPLLVLVIGSLLFIIWKIFDSDQPFYGLETKGFNRKPYFIMLLIMLPLVAAASTQADFLAVYPKLKSIEGVFQDDRITGWHKLLFEFSYGSDFITIELFFRGFLVLAFVKWAGRDAILPMACFYCTIHFGKPLGECISSYFGGIILGIIVYNTRSIWGGFLVHLGIAWMMELGGYIGNNFY